MFSLFILQYLQCTIIVTIIVGIIITFNNSSRYIYVHIYKYVYV